MATKLSQFAELTRTIHGLTQITARAYFEDEVFAFYSHTPYPEWFKDPFESHKALLRDPVDPITCFTTARYAHYGIVFSPPYALVLGPVLDPFISEDALDSLLNAVTTDPGEKASLAIVLGNCPRMSVYSLMPLLINTGNLVHFRDAEHAALDTAEPAAGSGMNNALPEEEPLSFPLNAASTEISFYDDENPSGETHHQRANTLFLDILRQGDVEAMRDWMLNPAFALGPLPLADDPLRNSKNNFLLQSALLSMTALQGGLPQELSDELLSAAIRNAESADSEAEILPMLTELADRYAESVRRMQGAGDRDSIVINTKRYIHTHLYTPLRTETIAEALFVSRSYLSQIFSELTGQTLSSYVRQQKIKEAKRLLLNDQYSLSQISDMLCFSSQSYFTNVFKKFTGMTPKEYRDSR